jgi:hypothetical protein
MQSGTIPNWHCPLCGAKIFFFQNEYGSRVYFDDLGPPWPKHPCMDQFMLSTPRTEAVHERPTRRASAAPGGEWTMLRYIKMKFEDDWRVLYFEQEGREFPLRILNDCYTQLPRDRPVYMLGWDDNGYTVIEFLDEAFSTKRVLGWHYARWCTWDKESCVRTRTVGETRP